MLMPVRLKFESTMVSSEYLSGASKLWRATIITFKIHRHFSLDQVKYPFNVTQNQSLVSNC